MKGVLPALALLFAAAAPAAEAASFDCAKARTKVEKEICATPALSRLDEQLAAAYRAVMARTPTPAEVSLHQRWWLRERDNGPEGATPEGPYTGDALAHHYRQRLDELNGLRTRDASAPAHFPVARLGRACTPMSKRPCRVTGSGRVAAAAGAPELHYQLEQHTADDSWETGVVVFAPAAVGQLRPLLWTYGYGEHRAPRLLRSPAGWLLLAPWQDEESTGETPFRAVGGRWRDIETNDVWTELQKRVGEDRWAEDVNYDWERFAATAPLRWSSGQEGSAGTARVTYALEGDRFVIRAFAVTPAR